MSHTSDHREKAAVSLSPKGKSFFKMIEFDEDEQLVMEIRKHPFGLLLIIVFGIILSFIIAVLPLLLAAFADNEQVTNGQSANNFQQILVVVSIILGVSGLIVTIIAALLYVNNVIFVTSEKLAQVLYFGIFNRRISQLSIGDIQDITVKQVGIFPRIFNYGTLVVETAGEQQNYTFTYVPNPHQSSQAIVGAHEENLRLYGN